MSAVPAAVAAATAVAIAAATAAPGRPAPRRAATPARRRGRIRRIALLAAVAVGLAALGGASLALALTVGAFGWHSAHRWRRAQRATAARTAAVPEAIELLVVTVHAGLTPQQALRRLAACGPPPATDAFAAVVHGLDRGLRLADAVTRLGDSLGPAAHPLVDALASADRLGTPLAAVLERLSDEAAAARRRHAEADARRLPVRLSGPLVVCTLPAFVLLTIAPTLLGALSALRRTTP